MCKTTAPGEGEVRKFQSPSLDFDAVDYYCLVNWQDVPRTSPPRLRDIRDDEIEAAIEVPQKWTLEKYTYPCHTQSVERQIKVVTETAASVFGGLRRDGYIRAKLASRKEVLHFGSKKDWKLRVVNCN